MLKEHGYTTAAVISNFVLSKGRGYEQGFDHYDDRMENRELVRGIPERVAEATADAAIRVLKEKQGEPLFLWVLFQDPHGPYTPPRRFAQSYQNEEQDARSLPVNPTPSGRGGIPSYQKMGSVTDYHDYVARYDGEIRYMDKEIGRVIRALKDLGYWDHALIVFTSDHGEGMGEHDYYFAHGEYLYSNQIRVPLMVRQGDRLRGRRADFVQHLDIAPTVRSAAGLEPDPQMRGRDLRASPAGPAQILSVMRSPFVKDRDRSALTHDGLRLIHTKLYDAYELYDLTDGLQELQNRVGDPAYAKRVERMKAVLHQMRGEDRLRLAAEPALELTDEERAKLRSLGYIDP
jgi:arylsulfatase A-like enzyme